MSPFVQMPSLGGETIFIPQAFDMNQRALSLTEQQMLQSRDWQEVVFVKHGVLLPAKDAENAKDFGLSSPHTSEPSRCLRLIFIKRHDFPQPEAAQQHETFALSASFAGTSNDVYRVKANRSCWSFGCAPKLTSSPS